MFEQTLNLLPQQYRKVYIPFDSKKVVKVISLAIAFILFLSGVVFYLDYSLKNELESVKTEHKKAVLNLDDFRANNSKKSLDETIAVRIKKYEDMLRQRQAFLKRLNSENFGNTRGFSEYLLALARQKFPEIWIEELAIQGEAKAFGIRGKAVSAIDITEFLTSLQQEPAMNGIVFQDMDLSRSGDPNGDYIAFTISYGTFTGLSSGFGSGFSQTLANANLPDISRAAK